jgi:uncharacterized membrane protein YphA (DoxX/SURF4 family)
MPAPRTDFATFDARLTRWAAGHGLALLRISIGVIFVWFGVLKFFPGVSPAQDLAARTIGVLSFGLVPATVSVPLLAALETVIGLGLLAGRWLRGVLLLLLLQMIGTVTPLILFPGETFVRFPLVPTLEGQYILKNMVIVSAAIVLGATVRGGKLVADPAEARGRRRDS